MSKLTKAAIRDLSKSKSVDSQRYIQAVSSLASQFGESPLPLNTFYSEASLHSPAVRACRNSQIVPKLVQGMPWAPRDTLWVLAHLVRDPADRDSFLGARGIEAAALHAASPGCGDACAILLTASFFVPAGRGWRWPGGRPP